MKHTPYVIMIAALLVWVYELRRDHDVLVQNNREWSYSYDQIESIAMGYRRELQRQARCGRDI